MATDDERRRVAERLRDEVGGGSSWPGIERLGLILGVEREPRTGWEGRILTRLADLIDPDCEEDRYEGLRTVRAVDRDALLELASGLEADADRILRAARNARFGGGPRMGEAKHDAYEWRSIARSIREACGEVMDDEQA